jgi:predicted PurR-regulated permease PerM
MAADEKVVALPMPKSNAQARPPRISTVTSIVLAVGVLYFAQEVLIPLALSFMLMFLLAPLVTRLERLGLRRISAVLTVAVVTFGTISLFGWIVVRQVISLADDLPRYQDEIVRKAESLRGTGGSVGSNIDRLGKELEKAAGEPASRPAVAPAATQPAAGVARSAAEQFAGDPVRGFAREVVGASPATAPAPLGASPANPLFAVALPAPVSPIKTLGTYLGLVLGPLGTASLVVVFVLFMLLERSDLRDRLIRLISRGKYTVTTKAMDDAATRISRFMLAQTFVNGSYGLVVGVGLWVIGATMGHGTGFPSFVLWGFLCAVLRFIPYVGPFAAASFPILLSLAVYPGFSVFAATAGMLVVLELVSNNVMEPWLYGTSTGLSAVALMVAAVFWTWLWGPVGLLLSTPLTVCIVVMGKHVPHLKFLDVLLGDRPPLTPAVSYYQRLLAGDHGEAQELIAKHAVAHGAEAVPDEVLVPALRRARRDRADGGLSAEEEDRILAQTSTAVDHLLTAGRAAGTSPDVAPAAGAPSVTMLGCPSHHRSEELVLRMLGATLTADGVRLEPTSTRMLPSEIEATVDRDRPAVVVIAVLPPGGLAQARHLCRRLRKRFPELWILVTYLGKARDFDRLLVRLRFAGASYVNTSILQTRGQIRALLPPRLEAPPAADIHVQPITA